MKVVCISRAELERRWLLPAYRLNDAVVAWGMRHLRQALLNSGRGCRALTRRFAAALYRAGIPSA